MTTMNGPSPHLSWTELNCRCGKLYPVEWRENRAVELSGMFEEVRRECGNIPIRINSAYRCRSCNRKVGGVPKSQHIEGRALDMATPHSFTSPEFHAIVRGVLKKRGGGGCGAYKTFCHGDIRSTSGGRIVGWRG